jgi:hypothetical protein
MIRKIALVLAAVVAIGCATATTAAIGITTAAIALSSVAHAAGATTLPPTPIHPPNPCEPDECEWDWWF